MSAAAATAILKRTITATRLIYFLYQVTQIALSPAVALYLLYRGIRAPRYFQRIEQRFGFLPNSLPSTGAASIWLHAVSVGEIMAAIELLRQLRSQRPSVKLYVSTTTLAGRDVARQKMQGLVDAIFYAPLDYRSIVRRVLRKLRPALVVVMETEIWPNLYREVKSAGASLLVVNGRISDRALPRYQRWAWFFRAALQWPDAIFVQTSEDVRRYQITGAPPGRIRVGGNLKYDFHPPEQGIAASITHFLDHAAPEKVWIAASTMGPAFPGDPDEDDAVIAAFRKLAVDHSKLLLILAPRKPERFDLAAQRLSAAGIPFVRRSALDSLPAESLSAFQLPGALLLDSIGELAALFERADVVFMGGTLASRGGHNILEPAYFGKPVIAGPHMENFSAIAEEFGKAGAFRTIHSASDLAGTVSNLLRNPGDIGQIAQDLSRAKRGVTARLTQEIWHAFEDGVPNVKRSLFARLLLTPLSWLWYAGHRWNMARSLAHRKSLKTPVISIGGVAMGGTGKSPLVAHLAHRFTLAGKVPAILTRGYRRREPGQSVVVVSRGQTVPASLTGDEAQIFIRAGDAHVGISQNRFAAGEKIEQEFHPDIFLLDDGFQHFRLQRRCDVVLLDALDPFAGGLFPLGRRREPMHALARATILIVNRAERGRSMAGIERLIRKYNSDAPIFHSRVVPKCWVDAASCVEAGVKEAGFHRVAAFCGLGNPASFWLTLESLGLDIVYRWAFGDHHTYSPSEVRRIASQARAAGAEIMVTTEKDLINLCDGALDLLAPMKLNWLKIGVEIDREEELLRLLL